MNDENIRKCHNRLRVTFTVDGSDIYEVIYPIMPITDELTTVQQQFDDVLLVLEQFNSFTEHFITLFKNKLRKYLKRTINPNGGKEFTVYDVATIMIMPIDTVQFLLEHYKNFTKPILTRVEIIDTNNKVIEHTLNTGNSYRLSTLFFLSWHNGDDVA